MLTRNASKNYHKNISYKCCNRIFSGYVCTKCSRVYHESCMSKLKNIEYLENNKIICCTLDLETTKTNDFSLLEQTIQELGEENNDMNNYISKLKQQNKLLLREAEECEEHYTKTLKQKDLVIEDLQNQLNAYRLKEKANNMKEYKSVGTQSYNKQFADKSTLTKLKTTSIGLQTVKEQNFPKSNRNKKTSSNFESQTAYEKDGKNIAPTNFDSQRVHEKNTEAIIKKQEKFVKNRILLVSGHQGRRMADMLIRQSPHTFSVQSILKPNCSDETLLKTVLQNSSNLTNNDFVIIWPNRLSYCLQETIKQLAHTNVIVISMPFRNYPLSMCNISYNNNLHLLKWLHCHNIKYAKLIDCNFTLHSNSWNVSKWHLCSNIVRTLRIMGVNKTASNCDSIFHQTSPLVASGTVSCGIQKSLAEELAEVEESDSKNSFTDSQLEKFFR